MLDAADLAVALSQATDWREAIRETKIKIRKRAQANMR